MKTTVDPKELPPISKRTEPWTLEERRAFAKLPIEQRRRMLEEMAAEAATHYNDDAARKEREEWQVGDIVEY
ncbi:MAG: hypothetical protein AB1489_41050 [Acidobacteriota bacterium]